MEEQKFLIYGLYCPFTGEIHYVGKTRTGLKRPFSHLNNSHSEKINEWVDGLKLLGYLPEIKVLETCNTDDELIDKEKFWVYKFVAENKKLLNISLMRSSTLLIEARDRILSAKETVPADDDLPANPIAEFVKKRRKLTKLTQEEFAAKAGVGLRFLRELEQGKESLKLDKILQVLNMFGAVLVPHKN